jgi:hypothetical protein
MSTRVLAILGQLSVAWPRFLDFYSADTLEFG